MGTLILYLNRGLYYDPWCGMSLCVYRCHYVYVQYVCSEIVCSRGVFSPLVARVSRGRFSRTSSSTEAGELALTHEAFSVASRFDLAAIATFLSTSESWFDIVSNAATISAGGFLQIKTASGAYQVELPQSQYTPLHYQVLY